MKTATEFSARSQRSFDEQFDLEAQIAHIQNHGVRFERKIAELEKTKASYLKHAAQGKSYGPFFEQTLDELRTAGLALAAQRQHESELTAKLNDLITVTPEEFKTRNEQQSQLAGLATSRLEADRQTATAAASLRQAIELRAELTARMSQVAAGIEFETKDDVLDAQRFEDLLSALPGDIAERSERWAGWFLGKQRDTKPYVVRVACVAVRETLAHHGFYRFGEMVELTDEQARELLREDRPGDDFDSGFKPWASAPPSVVTVEAHEAALAEADEKGVPVEQMYFWQDMERNEKIKAAGRSSQPANTSIGRTIKVVAEPQIAVRAKGTITAGASKSHQAGDVFSQPRGGAARLVESGAAERP